MQYINYRIFLKNLTFWRNLLTNSLKRTSIVFLFGNSQSIDRQKNNQQNLEGGLYVLEKIYWGSYKTTISYTWEIHLKSVEMSSRSPISSRRFSKITV